MIIVNFCSYRKVIGYESIIRVHDVPRADGSLKIDLLHGDGWWRCEPKSQQQIDDSTELIADFQDTYPQIFLGRDRND